MEDRRLGWRRVFALGALALLLSATIVACGDSGGGGSSSGGDGNLSEDEIAERQEKADNGEIVVGYADGFGANSWRKVTLAELEDEVAETPAVKELIYTNAEGSPQKAIANVNSLRNQGVDIIIMLQDAGAAVGGAVRQATQAGITTGVFAIPVTAAQFPESGTLTNDPRTYSLFVNEEGCENGENYASYVAEKLPKGKVGFLGGPEGNTYSELIYECAERYFGQSAPGIELLPAQWTDWDVQKAQASAQTLLAKYGTLDGLIADYGALVPSVLEVFRNNPWPKVIAAQEYNGLNRLWVENKGKFDLGNANTRTWGMRQTLRAALAHHLGKEACTAEEWEYSAEPPDKEVYEKCVPTFPQWNIPIVDAASIGDKVWDNDMPDEWFPTSELPHDEARSILGVE